MAQIDKIQLLRQFLSNEDADPFAVLGSLFDRNTGTALVKEGLFVDFKRTLTETESAIGELARDILAFSNTEGGILLIGIADDGHIVGTHELKAQAIRASLAPYIGTRIEYDFLQIRPVIRGSEIPVCAIIVRRSESPYPTLLRKDVDVHGTFRKAKYLRGSLFYRNNDCTCVEHPGGEVEERAISLGFTLASPRTRSSFVTEDDRPGVRLFAHINDRFFGRDEETNDLVSKFDDARGRGISIAGQGGIGKTELAIEIAKRLYRSGRFKAVYSGSAKRTVMGPTGVQDADPTFQDYPSFLRDLASWLGMETFSVTDPEDLGKLCTAGLSKLPRTLLFIDNLETITDGRLFQFLEDALPKNVWLLTTSRVHKIKNWIFSLQLEALKARDAARLLRHELKKQGLQQEASSDIKTLEDRSSKLHKHPLAIRWYAWGCKRSTKMWAHGPENVPRQDLESFCVGHTLQHLNEGALRVLASIACTQGQLPLTLSAIEAISGISESTLDSSLSDLESAGMISVFIHDETGQMTYSVVPMAMSPARDIARQHHYEQAISANLRRFLQTEKISTAPEDPLLRDLLEFDPRKLKQMEEKEIEDIKKRISRVNARKHDFETEMFALLGECERQMKNVITADEYYQKGAELILANRSRLNNEQNMRILLEAATVARQASHAEAQIRRAITYLEAIDGKSPALQLRVLGSLVELYAIQRNREIYEDYLARTTKFRDENQWRFSFTQLKGLDDALERAEVHISKPKLADKSKATSK